MVRLGGRPWLISAALALLALSAIDAESIDVCGAEQVIAQDPGCPAGDGVCTITQVLTVVDSAACKLDFGARAVVVTGKLEGAGTVELSAGTLTVDPGARIRAPNISITTAADVLVRRVAGSLPGLLDVSGFDGGTLRITTPGSVLLDGRINANAGGAGKYAGTIEIQADTAITTGPDSLLSADAPISDDGSSLYGELFLTTNGPVVLQGTVTLRGPTGGEERTGGSIAIVSGPLRLAPGVVLRGGTISVEVEGDVSIERESPSRRALVQANESGASLLIVATGNLLVAGEVTSDGSTCNRGSNSLALVAGKALTITAQAVLRGSGVPEPEEDDVCAADMELEGGDALLFEGTLVALGMGHIFIGSPGNVTVRGRFRLDGWYHRSSAGELEVQGANVVVDGEITALAGASTLGIEYGGYSGFTYIQGDDVTIGGSIKTDGPTYGVAGSIVIEGESRVTVTGALSARRHRLGSGDHLVTISANLIDFRGQLDVGNGAFVGLIADEIEFGGSITGHLHLADRYFAGGEPIVSFQGGGCGFRSGRVSLTGAIDLSAFGCDAGTCADPWTIEVAGGEVTLSPSALLKSTGRIGGAVLVEGEILDLAGRIDVSGSVAHGSVEVSTCPAAEQPECAISGGIKPPEALVKGCPSATPAPSPTATADPCPGDCDGDGVVGNADLLRVLDLVTLCQGSAGGCPAAPVACMAADRDGSGTITAAEVSRLLASMGSACGGN